MYRANRAFPGKRNQAGFSLIENMVTLFILSVGLLGIAGMQATALKMHQSSYHYNRALTLAQGLADRMRANSDGVENGYYNYLGENRPTDDEENSCFTTTGCSPAEMAGHDEWEWTQALRTELPSGIGFVCIDSTPEFSPSSYLGQASSTIPASCDNQGSSYVIHVVWDMDVSRDGQLNISTDIEQADGHFIMAFEP